MLKNRRKRSQLDHSHSGGAMPGFVTDKVYVMIACGIGMIPLKLAWEKAADNPAGHDKYKAVSFLKVICGL